MNIRTMNLVVIFLAGILQPAWAFDDRTSEILQKLSEKQPLEEKNFGAITSEILREPVSSVIVSALTEVRII
jgi:hypothetical protein